MLGVCEELRAVQVLGSPPPEMCSHNSHFSFFKIITILTSILILSKPVL